MKNNYKGIANINGEWRMTWVVDGLIADRKLYWWEKIRYWNKFVFLRPKFKKDRL